MKDKYKAVWVSHSSISDFLKCPRAYFLKNVYKDPKTNHKIQMTQPALALGQAVHEVIESLSTLPTNKRFEKPLHVKFEKAWEQVTGKRGGFRDREVESQYKQRGIAMIEKVSKNPGVLKRLSVKIDMDLPNFWLSEDDNIILCGKVDWLEYIENENSVNIVDFKTGKEESEDPNSLQLPIYHLLVKNCQNRDVNKAYYWYIERDEEMQEKELPDLEKSKTEILTIAKKMKVARQLESFNCPKGENGCRECTPYEEILKGKHEYVYTDSINRDIYISKFDDENREGTVL